MEEYKTIGEIVAEDYRTAEVFQRYGIDFCCGGKKTLLQACTEKNINPGELKEVLASLPVTGTGKMPDFQNWDLDLLVDYIEKKHHRYVREKLPQLVAYSQKVAGAHGKKYPETVEIASLVRSLAQELMQHLRKEEMVLFPYVREMVSIKPNGDNMRSPAFVSVENPVRVMEKEHETAGNAMKQIRQLSNDYSLPAGACNTFRVLYALLEEFEKDLHQHVHLENNILFPGAKKLEERLVDG